MPAVKPRKVAEKTTEKLFTPEAVTTGAAAGLSVGALAGVGAGVAVAVVVHAAKTYTAMRDKERDSAYRYLTMMERAGVAFRSDLGGSAHQADPHRLLVPDLQANVFYRAHAKAVVAKLSPAGDDAASCARLRGG